MHLLVYIILHYICPGVYIKYRERVGWISREMIHPGVHVMNQKIIRSRFVCFIYLRDQLRKHLCIGVYHILNISCTFLFFLLLISSLHFAFAFQKSFMKGLAMKPNMGLLFISNHSFISLSFSRILYCVVSSCICFVLKICI